MRIKSLSIVVCVMLLLTLAPFYMMAEPVAADGPTQDGAGTLTLLHNNDGESALLPIEYEVAPDSGYPNTQTVALNVGSVAAFKTVADQQITEAHGAGNAVVNVYAGDAFLASATLACSLPPNDSAPVYDAVAQRQIAYDAHILGNHEFDYSPDYLERFIRAFDANDGNGLTQPFLSSNLDFAAEAGFNDLVDQDGLIVGQTTDGRVVARSLIMTDTTQRFGIVGATTPQLPNISSPRNVTVTATITETAAMVQQEIDRLYDEHGVRKIIFVSHLQSVSNDQEIIPMLKRVDVAVAGGGDELLTNSSVPTNTQMLPGESAPIGGQYPLQVADADGRTVYLVTSVGNYKYLGRLDVVFDGNGEVTSFNADTSYPRRVIPTSDAATALGVSDAVAMNANIVSSVNEPVQQCLQDLENTAIARTEVSLNVSRASVRGSESNAGNMIADSFLYMYEQYSNTNGLRSGMQPVIAMQNGGGIRQNAGDVLSGTISQRNTMDVLPFSNLLSVVQSVTPTDTKGILEHSADRLPGLGGQFMQVAGFKVTYHLRNEVGSRVVNVELNDGTKIIENGAIVDGAPSVTVITNNFIARGGDGYPQLGDNPNQSTLRDDSGTFIFYERAWREYLQTLPVSGNPALPTVSGSDPRYQPGGEGRITITTPNGAGRLTLLHNNDGESALLPIEYSVAPNSGYPNTDTVALNVGSVAAFKTLADQQITEAHGAGNAVVNVYAGDAFLASATLACSLPPNDSAPVYDAVAQRQIAYDAHILGNHEFDYSPDYLERFIRAFDAGDGNGLTQPFLSSNLDFAAEAGFNDLVDQDGLIVGQTTDGRVVAHSLIMTDTTQRFGIVGATTPQLPNISSPRNVTVTATITETAAMVQQEIDRLYDQHGVRKIIFVSHLQSVSNDQEIIPMLKRVDVAVAGGGDELLTNSSVPTNTQMLPGESAPIGGQYPIQVADADGRTVYLVTSVGNYKYLGRLDVEFDGNGEVASFNAQSSYPRRVIPTSDAATALGVSDAVAMDAGIVSSVNDPVQQCLQDLENTAIARTEVSLNVSRASVRGSESNAGNMIADSFLYMYEQYSNTNGMEPVIALQNGGGIRQNAGDVLSGTISQRNTMDVLPFSNLLSVVQSVTPTDTKGILEHSADRLPDLGGQFLQVAGFTVTYSLQNDVGSRVVSVELKDGTKIIENGAIVNGAPSVTVITNSFVARGGDGYSQFGDNPNQSTLRDDSGTFIFYERAWREYLQTLPVSGNPALPTVLASDPRYQPGGEGRITIIPADVTAIDLAELNSSGTSVPVWPLAVGMMLISLGLLSIARRRTL